MKSLIISIPTIIIAQSGELENFDELIIGNISLEIGPDSLIIPEKTTIPISQFDLSRNYSSRTIARRFNSLSDMIYRHIIVKDRKGARQGKYTIKSIEEKIQNYGCYCFPENGKDITVNKGLPVDKMDGLCRMLSRCHRCIYNFDFFDENCEFSGKYKYNVNNIR